MGGGQVGMGVGGMMASSPSSTTGDVPTLQRMDRFELRYLLSGRESYILGWREWRIRFRI